MTINFNEIYKLNDLLNEAKIPHTFTFFDDGFQIVIFTDEKMTCLLDDCVLHSYSHGSEKGLLETYFLGNCNGYETAEKVFKGWQKKYNKAKKRLKISKKMLYK